MDDRGPDVAPAVVTTADEIAAMEIRGAATIADAAAEALAIQAERSDAERPDAFERQLRAAAKTLYETRPTAVSLPNALRYVLAGMDGETVAELRASTIARAEEFQRDLAQAQSKLGSVGANRLRDGDVVMTHCHSTDALACLEAAVEDGTEIEAIVKETRPRLQGHITARQLREWDVPVTVIVDGAARRYLDQADHVLVGADSIAADGSVINKIGTSGLAVIARERGVPVTVAAQTIKLHPDTMTGHTVEIERRDEREVLDDDERAAITDTADGADDGLTVENPAFDVTPPRYVDAIVTEHGQFPPETVVTLMRELFGETVDEPWEL
ncbi:translation initiation factor, aIF-2BII family [Haloterrigena turkmenica DSM 5511]|uniref:Ribose 1,5-bisphosphate isomerase n=1 Tax=Haloterrigena turkmenica (strain ATCC 51198 / DSM 5511 / JCM 9101 / NCIMB 13204 / VKM B-1734 / 4k) TaxID=543526 RepID=R15PI_HALTV|nr:ribose 1,5-bisphosphate isomerase [Haloterrigena turkmenica]ADB59469.1 translation initiation factor, aIF-2BII family [Haloterrigena turkmenica DSM 5511]BDT39450.1 ribose-1,5-bisphosphate isomerase [synthetic construct]